MNGIAILYLTQFIPLVLTILLALIYSIPLLLIRRFHNINNVFTVNLCFATICCCTYWLYYFIVIQSSFRDKICVVLNYFEIMCTLQVPLAVVEASVHRLCSVVYFTKSFFKTKQWAIICIASQWTIGIIVSLPGISSNDLTCGIQTWMRFYAFIMIVCIPSLICSINNIIIFNYVRSSTNRVQPSSSSVVKNNQCINRRDLHLLRHMIIMFCVFVGGWSPIHIYTIITFQVDFTSIIVPLFLLLAELSLFFNIINLFLYNHGLRQYLHEKFFRFRYK